MNIKPCRISGCTRAIPARSYSPLCDTHRTAEARHGHPTARHLTTYELAPWLKVVTSARHRNPSNGAWSILEKRLEVLRAHSAAVVAEYEAGKPSHRPTRQAAQAVLQVTQAAAPSAVIDTLLAVAVMREQSPRRWPSDRAYRFALVRRFRGRAPMAVSHSWNHKRRVMRAVYRCMPPRATDILGQWLIDLLGAAGVLLAQAEARRLVQPALEQERLHTALNELQ